MKARWSNVIVIALLGCSDWSAQGAIVPPLLEYTLNDADATTTLPAGAAVTNSGVAGTPGNLTMFGSGAPGTATNFYSADGGGVSGLPGDRAFNNTASTAMGNQGVTYSAPSNRGPRATNDTDNGILNGRTALTVTGWLKTEGGQTWRGLAQVWAGDAGQFMNIRTGDAGAGNAGKIEFDFRTGTNTSSALVRSSTANWTADNQWMFFAVTWDGGTGAVGMHYVDGLNQIQSSTTAYAGSATLGIGAIQDTSQSAGTPATTYGLSLGNQGGYALRPFDGLLDNFRVFNAVLDTTDLQFVVNSDLQNVAVPEPATIALALVAGPLVGLVHHRRRSA
jgi:hypothetical protein